MISAISSGPQQITQQQNQPHSNKASPGLNRTCMVCHIALPNSSGTGILIGRDLIMTHKCAISSLEAACSGRAIFFPPESQESVEVRLKPKDFFYTGSVKHKMETDALQQVEFVIVSIEFHLEIQKISYLAFSIFDIPYPKRQGIFQLVYTQSDKNQKHCQFVCKEVISTIAQSVIQYTTAHPFCSSGAAVLDEEEGLIGLHLKNLTWTFQPQACGLVPIEMIYRAISSNPCLQEIACRYLEVQKHLCDQEAINNYIKTNRCHPHYQLIMRGLAKRIWDESSQDVARMKQFFALLCKDNQDLVGSYQVELLLACLNACPHDDLEKYIWEEYRIASSICSILSYKYQFLCYNDKLDCLIRSMSHSKRAYDQVKSYIQVKEEYRYWFVQHFDDFSHQESLQLMDPTELVKMILNPESLFYNEEEKIQQFLIDSFKQADQKVISQIIQLLQRNFFEISKVINACGVLKILAAALDEKGVFDWLDIIQSANKHFIGLDSFSSEDSSETFDESQRTRIGDYLYVTAMDILKGLVQKGTTSAIFDWIQKAMINGDSAHKFWIFKRECDLESRVSSRERRTVFEMVAMNASPTTFPLIFQLIQMSIVDRIFSDTCYKALEIVVKRLDESIDPRCFEWGWRNAELYLQNKNEIKDVFRIIAQKMVQVTIISDMIKWIKESLNKPKKHIREGAILALQAIASQADTQSVVLLLQQALQDPEPSVRRVAIESLNYLPPFKERNSLILEVVLDQYSHPSDSVSYSASKLLENHVEKLDEKEIAKTVYWIEQRGINEFPANILKAIAPKLHVKILIPLLRQAMDNQVRPIDAAETLEMLKPLSQLELAEVLNFINDLWDVNRWDQDVRFLVINAFAHYAHLELQSADQKEKTEKIVEFLKRLQEKISREENLSHPLFNNTVQNALCNTLCTFAPYAITKDMVSLFLEIIKSSLLKSLDTIGAVEVLNIIYQCNNSSAIQILKWHLDNIQEIMDSNWGGIGFLSNGIEDLLQDHIQDGVDTMEVFDLIKHCLNRGSNSDDAKVEFAVSMLSRIAPYLDDNMISTFLELVQKCLGYEKDVRKKAILVLGELDRKWMAYIVSQQKYDQFIPIIFEYLLNRSIPLHILHENGGKFVSTHPLKKWKINDQQIQYLTHSFASSLKAKKDRP